MSSTYTANTSPESDSRPGRRTAELRGHARSRAESTFWLESDVILVYAAAVASVFGTAFVSPLWADDPRGLFWPVFAFLLAGGPVAFAVGLHMTLVADQIPSVGRGWRLGLSIVGGLFLVLVSFGVFLSLAFPNL